MPEISDRAQRFDPAGAASPSSGAPMSRADLLAELTRLGAEGFERGYSAGVDQLAEPITAVWLASESGLPKERCRAILADLREMLLKAGNRG